MISCAVQGATTGLRRPQRRLLAADMFPRPRLRHPTAAGMGQVRAVGSLPHARKFQSIAQSKVGARQAATAGLAKHVLRHHKCMLLDTMPLT